MVLKEHLKLQDLRKSLLPIYKSNKKDIFDIILYGSFVKGKEYEFRKDIDICIIFKEKLNKEIIKELSKLKDIHINYLYITELYSQSLWKTLIREGISIVYNKKLSTMFGLESYGLYTYDLRGLIRKSRFSQILKGYKSDSILKKVNGTILKPGVILVPIKHIEYFRTFLETWNVKYKLKYIYISELE